MTMPSAPPTRASRRSGDTEDHDMARKKRSFIKGTFRHRRTEADYMSVLLDAVPLEDWRAVVMATVAAAKAGDAGARGWLAQYLVGKPAMTAPAPLTVLVQQMSGRDPLVDKLAITPLNDLEYPEDRAEERPKDRIRALITAELRALEAEKESVPTDDVNSIGTIGSADSCTS